MAHEGQFEVMDDACAVHGLRGNEALLHPIDENRREPDLDHMGSDADNHRPALAMGLRDRVGHGTQRFDSENVGKGSIEQTEAASAAPRLCKIRDAHLAVPLLEWIRL